MSDPRLHRITVRPLLVSNLHRRRGEDLFGSSAVPRVLILLFYRGIHPSERRCSRCPGTQTTRDILLTSAGLYAMRREPTRQRAPGSARQLRRSTPHLPRRARSSLLSHCMLVHDASKADAGNTTLPCIYAPSSTARLPCSRSRIHCALLSYLQITATDHHVYREEVDALRYVHWPCYASPSYSSAVSARLKFAWESPV